MGPHAVGKDTQAHLIADYYSREHQQDFVVISIGDLIRNAKETRNQFYQQWIDAFNNAPNETKDAAITSLFQEIVRREVEESSTTNLIFTGFPRKKGQAEKIPTVLTPYPDVRINAIRYFAGAAALDERIKKRVAETVASGEEPRPTDDVAREATVRKHYLARLKPALRLLRERGVLQEIDANGSIERVFTQTRDALQHTYALQEWEDRIMKEKKRVFHHMTALSLHVLCQ